MMMAIHDQGSGHPREEPAQDQPSKLFKKPVSLLHPQSDLLVDPILENQGQIRSPNIHAKSHRPSLSVLGVLRVAVIAAGKSVAMPRTKTKTT